MDQGVPVEESITIGRSNRKALRRVPGSRLT